MIVFMKLVISNRLIVRIVIAVELPDANLEKFLSDVWKFLWKILSGIEPWNFDNSTYYIDLSSDSGYGTSPDIRYDRHHQTVRRHMAFEVQPAKCCIFQRMGL
jgi:hypothetical protein